jgi:hypothetical protein
VFSIASNRYNKPAKLLTRALTRPSKTSKKRSNLIPIPSIPVAKKVRPRAAP